MILMQVLHSLVGMSTAISEALCELGPLKAKISQASVLAVDETRLGKLPWGHEMANISKANTSAMKHKLWSGAMISLGAAYARCHREAQCHYLHPTFLHPLHVTISTEKNGPT
eukprot:gnl/TRDRNA2_/TRDRNA2_75832_c0_seq1.p1 gnl/TRDRNA2_/TRDRNA2_75832_c0~~gnl/TRDRNA2_/TRDRNA2_75832_c0_seq1.p1  ORF type:complete len:113 (-),score=11.24 gnl/TRDRNA2_/TRDRNA2_75832_c0_seq1:354-692(-)